MAVSEISDSQLRDTLSSALQQRGLRASESDVGLIANQLAVLAEGLERLRHRMGNARMKAIARRSGTARKSPLQRVATHAEVEPATEPWYMTAEELRSAYTKRALSPVEVAEATLERIANLDPQLRAYVTVMADSAMVSAKQSERRLMSSSALSPLDGVLVGVKDLFDTRGIRITGGCPLFAERIPDTDAAVVRRLRGAGAVIAGKQTLDELGIGYVRENGVVPVPINPWNPEGSPGGSSSGSAVATAAGLSTIAIGTDTGGSVRYPAACCGVVGLKPTAGLVSLGGCIPYSRSLDHAGLLGRSANDVALTLRALRRAGKNSNEGELPIGQISVADLRHVRVGIPMEFVESLPDLQPDILACYKQTVEYFASNSAAVELVKLPDVEIEPAIYATIVNAEGFSCYEAAIATSPDRFGASAYRRLLVGIGLSAADYLLALAARNALRAEMATLMASIDVIVLPTAEREALVQDKEPDLPGWVRSSYRHPFNVTGQPAVSIPAGFTERGVPIGMQLVGAWFKDDDLLAIASTFEHDHPQRKRPPIFN